MSSIRIEAEWDEDGQEFKFEINGEEATCEEATRLLAEMGTDVKVKKTSNIKIGGDDEVGRTESIYRG